MNTTKQIYFGAFVLAVLLFASAVPAFAASGNPAKFDITLLRTEPVPVKPGDTVDVWLQVINAGDTSGDAILYVDDSYPFKVTSSQDSQVHIGSLATTAWVGRVSISVNQGVADGTYNLPVRVSSDGVNFAKSNLQIEVRSTSSTVSVVSAVTDPVELIPGTPSKLTITVQNTQAGLLRDVTAHLNLESSVFSPVNTTTQQTISRLDGNAESSYVFEIVADPKAPSSIYRIPVTFSFTTSTGATITQTDTVGVIVHAKPEIAVIVDKVNVFTDNKEGTVVLRIVNKGLSQVKFTQVAVQDGTGYTIADSSRNAYIGNIDSDDFQTSELTLTPTGKKLALNVVVTYSDALNTAYSKTYTLQVAPKTATSSNSTSIIVIVIVLVLVIGGFVLWRRRGAATKKR